MSELKRGKEEKIATLEERKRTLGTTGTMTVFRKLKELGYLSSYSHRGKYYTLHDLADRLRTRSREWIDDGTLPLANLPSTSL